MPSTGRVQSKPSSRTGEEELCKKMMLDSLSAYIALIVKSESDQIETEAEKVKTETEQIQIDSEKIKKIETMEEEEAELK